MTIEDIIEGVVGREGGYSNNPADPGGETMWGWTKNAARAAGYAGEMRDMPRTWATAAYLRKYVQQPGFDKVAAVSMRIAEELVDTGVNMGALTPAPWLQRCLNALNRQQKDYADITADGVIGPATIGALTAFLKKRGADGEKVLLRALNGLQLARYIDIVEHRPQSEEFLYGWIMNRVEV